MFKLPVAVKLVSNHLKVLVGIQERNSLISVHSRKFNLTKVLKDREIRASNQQSNQRNSKEMRLSEIVQKLESFAPTKLAEKWDNVGLLVEPSEPVDIRTILLTNDLSEDVLKEAKEIKANLIISYHPPIFSGLKQLTTKTWKERIIVGCIENRIAVYSPHTSWDSCSDGVNDWLANSLPISSKSVALPIADNPIFGAGRVCSVSGSLTLREAIESIKSYTGLPDIRVGVATAGSLDSQIKTFGVCAGSGASVLREIKEPLELFITGELGHHEALEAIHQQINVVTLNHSNSERGFLKEFKKTFEKLLDNREVNVIVSTCDADPLTTY